MHKFYDCEDHDEGLSGAHGSGSWKIALADLMTVLMVFFLVMWLTAIMEPEDRRLLADSFSPIKSEGAQDTHSLPEQKGEVLINPLELKPLTKADIESLVKKMDASVEETPEHFLITLRSDKAFESGRASLQEAAKAQLELMAEELASRRNRLVITGHTDHVPIRNVSFPSNWELSSARASSVARLFEDFGVDKQFMTVSGRADAEPLVPNDTNIGRAQNRRIVILLEKQSVPLPAEKVAPKQNKSVTSPAAS
jgi:chemotaxis protein MotB